MILSCMSSAQERASQGGVDAKLLIIADLIVKRVHLCCRHERSSLARTRTLLFYAPNKRRIENTEQNMLHEVLWSPSIAGHPVKLCT